MNSVRYFGTKKIFNCPEAGEGQTEIDILEWFVKPGDNVKIFDIIGRGKYEKADIDIIAPYAGKVEQLFVDAGSVATIHKPLIEFEVEGDDSGDAGTQEPTPSKQDTTEPSATQTSTTSPTTTRSFDGPILTTPAVRRLARENNIDLKLVPGTGKDGRILKEDMLNFIAGTVAPIDRTATQPTQTQTQTRTRAQKPVEMAKYCFHSLENLATVAPSITR